MKLVDHHGGIEVLPREQCLRLLAQENVGRLAVVTGWHPMILPVNYVLDGETILFRTDVGTKLDAASRAPVAFEVDRVDAAARSGWSVMVSGMAEEVTSSPEPDLEGIEALPQPWAPGKRAHLIRIVPMSITGRRLRGHIVPGDDEGKVEAAERRQAAEASAETEGEPDGGEAQETQPGPPFEGPATPVGALTLRPALRARRDQPLDEVARRMRDSGNSLVLVGEEADATAIATERDLVRALSVGLGPEAPVGAVAVEAPMRIPASMATMDAATAMLHHEVRHLLVVGPDGEVAGVLGMRDALRVLLRGIDPSVWLMSLRLALQSPLPEL